MADVITGGNDIGLWALWPTNIPEKWGNIDWKMKHVLFDIVMKSYFKNMTSHNTGKTETCHRNVPQVIRGQNHNGEVVDRSWLCFSLSQICVKCFTCRLMCADATNWNLRLDHALERLRSHEHSMEHTAATIIFSRRCNCSLWRIDTELASQVIQCEQYRKSPLPGTFGFCRKIYCWTSTGV